MFRLFICAMIAVAAFGIQAQAAEPATPRGFHERLYSDFVRLENGWVQARSVTLLYDGVMSNTVFWEETSVGEAIDPVIFTPPAQ